MSEKENLYAYNTVQAVMRSWVGNLIARPWLDKLILLGLKHVFFPLSRMWAAARQAHGEVDAFYQAVPLDDVPVNQSKTSKALSAFELSRIQIANTEKEWRAAFFADREPHLTHTVAQLKNLERLRLDHRSHYNATRFGFWHHRKSVGMSVANKFPSPDHMDNIYGESDHTWQQRFSAPASFPAISRSKTIMLDRVNCYWLRFQSPSSRLNDTVYARVNEPADVENPPTLIFGHGIGVEFDHWRNLVDFIDFFPKLGIRVIRPEAPWHGRRVPEGFYGGEYFLSTAPMGAFDFFTAQHQEWLVLMDWARQNSTAPVAIGGSSLGAQCAQSTAIRANKLTRRLQPDALFLLTHCAHVWEVALDGALADVWGLHGPLHDLGWNRDVMEHWLSKLDPPGAPCMPAENIVSVIGRADKVTPYKSGRRLQQLWQLPEENTFKWPAGHFSVPIRMVRHRQPIERFKQIIDRLQYQH